MHPILHDGIPSLPLQPRLLYIFPHHSPVGPLCYYNAPNPFQATLTNPTTILLKNVAGGQAVLEAFHYCPSFGERRKSVISLLPGKAFGLQAAYQHPSPRMPETYILHSGERKSKRKAMISQTFCFFASTQNKSEYNKEGQQISVGTKGNVHQHRSVILWVPKPTPMGRCSSLTCNIPMLKSHKTFCMV